MTKLNCLFSLRFRRRWSCRNGPWHGACITAVTQLPVVGVRLLPYCFLIDQYLLSTCSPELRGHLACKIEYLADSQPLMHLSPSFLPREEDTQVVTLLQEYTCKGYLYTSNNIYSFSQTLVTYILKIYPTIIFVHERRKSHQQPTQNPKLPSNASKRFFIALRHESRGTLSGA